jgi:alpha-tubulin suppressor-like RCC1 family protein
VTVTGLTGVQEIAAKWSHACARTADGNVFCWGRNYEGELGDGTTMDRLSPVRVMF